MAYEIGWQFDLNRSYSPTSHGDAAKYFMWLLAARLTGKIAPLSQGTWTIQQVSDGVSVGGANPDRWGLNVSYVPNTTKLKRGEGSASHSWIVLKSPVVNGSNWYMCLSYNTIDDGSIKIFFSKEVPSGGTINNTPTATDRWGGVYPPSALMEYRIGIEGENQDQRSHFCLGADGSFLSYSIPVGTDKVRACVMFLPLKETLELDQYPVFTFAHTADANYDLLSDGGLNGSQSTHPNYTGTINSFYQHRNIDTEDFYPSQVAVSLIKFPLIMYSQQANRFAANYRGLLKDVFYIGECPLTNGTALGDLNGSPEFIKLGSYLIPSNAALNI